MLPWLIAGGAAFAGAAVTSYAAVAPSAQLFGSTLRHTTAPNKLAITFDDGPNPAITPQLLNLLDRYNAKATFFVVGKYVRESPALAKEIVARGHLLGNHSDSHPNLFFCGPQETRDELLRCTETIHQATWLEPHWFRPPFGFRSPWLNEIAHRQNMRTVMWTLIPGDWHNKSLDWLTARMQPIANHVQQKLPPGSHHGDGLAGDILCLHDGYYAANNADRTRTLAALEYWLPRWRDLGLEFVTIKEAEGKAVEA